jgi:hypothetical protein
MAVRGRVSFRNAFKISGVVSTRAEKPLRPPYAGGAVILDMPLSAASASLTSCRMIVATVKTT